MRRTGIFILFITIGFGVLAQKISREQYIKRYSGIAVKEMKKFGIPASITLAQGILESDNGNSTLARKANNHFGIKCHNDWKGRTFTHDDDRPNECFRKYGNAEKSFYDHSFFLRKYNRYAFLFDLKITDYKSWAHGLKKAGYATNPKYAKLLIRIIEESKLYLYDDSKYKPQKADVEPVDYLADDVDSYSINPFGNRIKTENRIDYVIVEEGDTFESLAEKQGIRLWQLYKYNELTKGAEITTGQILYVQPKRRKADVNYQSHTLAGDENMYTVAQKYGIKLKNLYKLNRIEYGESVKAGTKLSLRKKVKAK